MHPAIVRCGGDSLVDSIRQTREHGVVSFRRGAYARLRANVRGLDRERKSLGRLAGVESGHVETALVKKLGGQRSHLSQSENGDFLQRHLQTPKNPDQVAVVPARFGN